MSNWQSFPPFLWSPVISNGLSEKDQAGGPGSEGWEQGSSRALSDSRGTSGPHLFSDPLLGTAEWGALGKVLDTHIGSRTSAYEPSLQKAFHFSKPRCVSQHPGEGEEEMMAEGLAHGGARCSCPRWAGRCRKGGPQPCREHRARIW